MSMDLAKKTFSTQPDYLIAGNAEIVTAVKEASAALKRGAPVVLNSDGKLAAISVSGSSAPYTVTTTGLYGILAEDAASGEDGIVYLSGEFFADALVLPGVQGIFQRVGKQHTQVAVRQRQHQRDGGMHPEVDAAVLRAGCKGRENEVCGLIFTVDVHLAGFDLCAHAVDVFLRGFGTAIFDAGGNVL